MKLIAETERLIIREMDTLVDSEFVFALLNSPKFIKYIGDRGVRSVEDAVVFINERYRQSYIDHGFGLYTVIEKTAAMQVGVCGFVKRPHLEHPDLGFAFLPEFERRGYGFESATSLLKVGQSEFGFSAVFAITSSDNQASGNLLEKLGFGFDGVQTMPDGESLNVYSMKL